jgi:DUF971 family protein
MVATVPVELDVRRPERVLRIVYNDGAIDDLPFELLRVESPSAEVQGHVPSQKITVEGKRGVGIERIEPVGNYAIKIVFDDGHDTGIYSWVFLKDMGERKDEIWQAYLDALEAAGGSR